MLQNVSIQTIYHPVNIDAIIEYTCALRYAIDYTHSVIAQHKPEKINSIYNYLVLKPER